MFPCALCEAVYASVNGLGEHLVFYHQCLSTDVFKCALCHRTFKELHTFKNHLSKKHVNIVGNNIVQNIVENDIVQNNIVENIVENNVMEDNVLEDILDNNINLDNDRFTLDNFIDKLYRNVELYIAQLYALPNVSRKLVDSIISGTSELMTSSVCELKDNVFNFLSSLENVPENFATEVDKLERMFATLSDPFEFMKSEHRRLHSFVERGVYIPPKSFEIGQEDKFVRSRDGPPTLERCPVTGQVIPLRNVLKTFLEQPGIFDDISAYLAELENSTVVRNFVQGELWQEISAPFKAQGKFVLPLHIQFDDLEPDNPLGSHHNVHALGSLCASIPCVRPEFESSLDNLFLLSLFESKHRKSFGNGSTFAPSIDELKFLEENGIVINVNGREIRVFFVCCLIIGDNAGLNAIEGFIESFRGNFFCRICKLHRDEIAHTCTPPPEILLRTVHNYAADVLLNDSSQTGINELCVWNDLPNFHCIQNSNCEVAHDLLEGVLRYDICNILFYLISVRGYFDINLLKDRIDAFDYGPSENSNKPPTSHLTLGRLESCSWNLSASEMLCLCRYLGVMIGDLIPEGVGVWKLYLFIQEIVEIVWCPVFEKGVEVYLSTLVQEHHQLYIQYFGGLKPKHHFLVHYCSLLRRNGPLIHISSLKLERNHRRATRYAKVCNSRVNFALSVAIKYQLYLCERLLRPEGFDRSVKTSGVSRIQVRMLVSYASYAEVLPLDPNSFVATANSAQVFGTLYSIGMIVVLGVDGLYPSLGKIMQIVLSGENIFLIVNVLRSDEFLGHIRSYAVNSTDQFSCVLQKDLAYHSPLWHRSYQDKRVVTLIHML